LVEQGVDGRIILIWITKNKNEVAWTGMVWPKVWEGRVLLWTR
jgi:hypothetical protein